MVPKKSGRTSVTFACSSLRRKKKDFDFGPHFGWSIQQKQIVFDTSWNQKSSSCEDSGVPFFAKMLQHPDVGNKISKIMGQK